MADWRMDPGWRLAEFVAEEWPEPPGARPTLAAELATDPTWATEYRENRPIATWYRELALDPAVVKDLRRRAERRLHPDDRRAIG